MAEQIACPAVVVACIVRPLGARNLASTPHAYKKETAVHTISLCNPTFFLCSEQQDASAVHPRRGGGRAEEGGGGGHAYGSALQGRYALPQQGGGWVI